VACAWRWSLAIRHISILDRHHRVPPPSLDAMARGSPTPADMPSSDGVVCTLLGVDQAVPLLGIEETLLMTVVERVGGGVCASFGLQPLRIVLHHSTLAFLSGFFTEVEHLRANDQTHTRQPPLPHATSAHHTAAAHSTFASTTTAAQHVSPPENSLSRKSSDGSAAAIEWLEVHPLHVCFDVLPDTVSPASDGLVSTSTSQTKAKTASLRSPAANVAPFARLVPIRGATFALTRVSVRDAPSWATAMDRLASEWWPQLLAQLPHALRAVPAVRSVVHLSAGLSSLLFAPVRPAPLRGLQRGSVAFVRSLAVEGLGLAARVLGVSKTILEQVDELLLIFSSEEAATERSGTLPSSCGADDSPSFLEQAQSYAHVAVHSSAQRLAYASELADRLSGAIDVRPDGYARTVNDDDATG